MIYSSLVLPSEMNTSLAGREGVGVVARPQLYAATGYVPGTLVVTEW
jgi:hypothetical protein